MYCPECGHDAGEAKFCPECGANLSGVKDALSDAAAGPSRKDDPAGRPEAAAASGGGGPRRLSPAVVWGVFAAVAVVLIVVVVMVSGGFGAKSADSAADGGEADQVEAVVADTSGTYEELVERANDLYDKGDAAFRDQQLEQGSAYFSAAAKIYQAAWSKKDTDPAVGTDLSVALFYSGDIEAAIDQVDAVLEAAPDFQKGWLNKGIFLSHQGHIAEKSGDTEQADKLHRQAKTALTRAVAIDPESDAGKQADQSLRTLGQE